jgi:hypothetical protein
LASEFLSLFQVGPKKRAVFADSGRYMASFGQEWQARLSYVSTRPYARGAAQLGSTIGLATWYRFAALRVLPEWHVQITAFISISYLYGYPDDWYGADFCANRQG